MSATKLVFAFMPICFTLCSLLSIRSAVADFLWSERKLSGLLWLVPGHAAARLASGAPGDLEKAAALAPTKAAALIELALQAESKGNLAAARRYLEEALQRDAAFRPRWAMINFLVRRGETANALKRAAGAAVIYEGDLTGLFDLCLRTGASPGEIYRTVVPPKPKAQREYLELLIQRGNQVDALPAALGLADLAQPRDRDLLFGLCDKLLAAGAGLKAAQLWKTLPRFGDAKGHCLDWSRRTVAGIIVIETGETVIRLELNGRQPESASVLKRVVIVEPGKRYHLRAIANGDDTIRGAVEWRWNGVGVGGGDRTDLELEATQQISELELVIRRLPGQRAAEGTLEITNIRLEPKSAALADGVLRGQAGGMAAHQLPGVAVLDPHHHEVERRLSGPRI